MPSQEEFEDKFRKKFEDWEAPAPAWENFQPFIPPQKNKKANKRFLLWWVVGSVLMVVGLGSIYISSTRQQQPLHPSKIAIQTSPQENTEANPSTANKPAQKNHAPKNAGTNVQTGKDNNQANILPNLPTQTGKDSNLINNNILPNLPTQAGKDSNLINNNILPNLPTQAGKDSNLVNINILPNLPTQAGKDSNLINNNILPNLPTQVGKDSNLVNVNILPNLPIKTPDNKMIVQKPDSIQQTTESRQALIAQALPILPIKNEFTTPTQTYKMDSTWKWDAKQNTVGKWSVAGYVAPIFTYKIVTPNTKDSIFIENFVANTKMSVQNRGYQIGGRIERRLGKRIGVYGGLQYQYTRLQTQYAYQNMAQTVVRVDSVQQYKLYVTPIIPRYAVGDVFVHHSLSAEIGVNYRVHWKRWESLVGAGIAYQHILKLQFKNDSARYQPSYQAHHFVTQASWQIGYALTSQKKIFVEPIFQNNHTRLFKGIIFDLRTYQVGWRMGIKWRL